MAEKFVLFYKYRYAVKCTYMRQDLLYADPEIHQTNQCCGSASIIMRIRDPKIVHMDPGPDPQD